jgi:hypothetical protein
MFDVFEISLTGERFFNLFCLFHVLLMLTRVLGKILEESFATEITKNHSEVKKAVEAIQAVSWNSFNNES